MSAASSAFSAADARRSLASSAPLRYLCGNSVQSFLGDGAAVECRFPHGQDGISASSFFSLASALVARASAASRAPSAFSEAKQYLYCPGARQLYHRRKINN